MPSPFRTPLCSLLGIEHPILQSGMGRIAGPELVAEVSNAGGLGILAGLLIPLNDLRQQIARVRELTDRPFGVNLWLHEALEPPTPPEAIPDGDLSAAQSALNVLRSDLGLPPQSGRPAPLPDIIAAQFDVIVEERVPVFSVGLGNPGPARVARCHERSVRVVAMAATLEDAQALESAGVDVLVVQGSEAGGHRSTWVKLESAQAASVGTMALVPEVVDSVKIPVVAAGGIADGRGLVAALALGAQGVLLGTRFLATKESMAAPFFKQAILDGGGATTRITDVFTGLYARGIRNRFLTEYECTGAPALPPLLQANAAQDIYTAAFMKGDGEHFPMLAGQSMGIIRDLPGAADVVRSVMNEAQRVVERLGGTE